MKASSAGAALARRLTMPEPADGDPFALRSVMAGVRLPLSAEARASLRVHVCQYVDAQKAAGRPPEEIIVAVKKLAFDAGFEATSHVVYTERLIGPDALIVELVGWCIQRYYSPEDGA